MRGRRSFEQRSCEWTDARARPGAEARGWCTAGNREPRAVPAWPRERRRRGGGGGGGGGRGTGGDRSAGVGGAAARSASAARSLRSSERAPLDPRPLANAPHPSCGRTKTHKDAKHADGFSGRRGQELKNKGTLPARVQMGAPSPSLLQRSFVLSFCSSYFSRSGLSFSSSVFFSLCLVIAQPCLSNCYQGLFNHRDPHHHQDCCHPRSHHRRRRQR